MHPLGPDILNGGGGRLLRGATVDPWDFGLLSALRVHMVRVPVTFLLGSKELRKHFSI